MTYAIIRPPFTLRFGEMPKKELEAYAAWFHQVLPDRVGELTKAVKSTSGWEGWSPDLTPESLDPLGCWLEGQVATRKKTEEEIGEQRAKLKFPVEIPGEQLTNRTFSLAMDVGMYFAQVVLEHLPGTRWAQAFGSRKFVDYGQPVIMGFGKVPLNPVRIVVVTARTIADGKPAELRKLYDFWAGMRSAR
jgi:hypothetical protein